ncbi:MAG: LysR family transcriptional regulator [Mesorhizobium sp.]
MSERKIDLGWMRIFVETVRYGSFSAAAASLGLTQPAVSYQIRRIEEQTSQPLLHRRSRGVELTPQGRRLFEVARNAVDETDALMREFQASNRTPVVRLRTDYAFSTLWLMPRISEFRVLNPGIDIQIVASQRFDRAEMESSDIAIPFGVREDFDANAALILSETVFPVCTPDYLDRNPELRTGNLASARLIHLDAAKPSPWFDWNDYFERSSIPGRAGQGGLRFNTYNLVIQAAVEHQGVALGWVGLTDSLMRAGVLVSVGAPLSAPERGYFLVPPRAIARDSERLMSWLVRETATSEPFS